MTSSPPHAPNGRDDSATQGSSPVRSPHWLTRKYAVVSGVLGMVMLILAAVAPLVSPVEQRSEVLIITVLFGLAGALMLYTAVDSNRQRLPCIPQQKPTMSALQPPIGHKEVARAMLIKQQAKGSRRRKLAGFTFALFFGLAGMIAPFVLSEGSDNPDARFLMIVGFSPVAISGALMVVLFGRALWAGAEEDQTGIRKTVKVNAEAIAESIAVSMATVGIISGVVLSLCAVALPLISTGVMRNGIGVPAAVMGALGMTMSLVGGGVLRQKSAAKVPKDPAMAIAPKARKAPVPRIPTSALFRFIVPAVIVILLVMIVAVILIVIAVTITPMV